MKKTLVNHPHLIIAACGALAFVLPARGAGSWRQAVGPLKTRWAKDVSPAKALPESPRTRMAREDWMRLNDLWDLKLGDGT